MVIQRWGRGLAALTAVGRDSPHRGVECGSIGLCRVSAQFARRWGRGLKPVTGIGSVRVCFAPHREGAWIEKSCVPLEVLSGRPLNAFAQPPRGAWIETGPDHLSTASQGVSPSHRDGERGGVLKRNRAAPMTGPIDADFRPLSNEGAWIENAADDPRPMTRALFASHRFGGRGFAPRTRGVD